MPLYEYRCEACTHQFEKIQRFSDDPISVCPSCGQGPVVKLLSSPAIQFKGSGWYITDYARKGREGATPASTSSSSGKGDSSASSDSKSESKGDSSSSSSGSSEASSQGSGSTKKD
jgi:putative FmdB family regulatory protein